MPLFLIVKTIWLFTAVSVQAQNIDADAVTGRWMEADKEAIIEIFKQGDVYYGKFVWFAEPLDKDGKPLKDDKNPDRSKRSNNLLGMTFMFDFKYDGKAKWINGKVYNPQDGRTYAAQLQMKDSNRLGLRGYIGIPALGRTEVWTRVGK